jgi:hypothetical protein
MMPAEAKIPYIVEPQVPHTDHCGMHHCLGVQARKTLNVVKSPLSIRVDHCQCVTPAMAS